MKPVPMILAATLVVGALQSQRIWLVRSTGGDFRTFPEAMAAASPGDSILVELTVQDAVIDKGVNVYFRNLFGRGVYKIRNIPAGQTALVAHARGLSSSLGGEPQLAFQIHDCAGTVRLVACVATRTGNAIESPTFTHIARCADVTFDECYLANFWVRDSTVRFHGGFAFGDVFPRFGGQDSSALDVENSEIILNRSALSGAPGGVRPVARMVNTRLRLDRTGVGNNPCQIPIDATGGTIELGPEARIYNNCGGPQIVGTATVLNRDWPTLWIGTSANQLAFSTGSGDVMVMRVDDVPGSSAYLFVGASGRKTPLPPYDDLWIDPSVLLLANSGTIPATGGLELRLRMGSPPFPHGFAYTFQAVSFRNGVPRISLPAQIVQSLIY